MVTEEPDGYDGALGRKLRVCGAEGAGRDATVLQPLPGINLEAGKVVPSEVSSASPTRYFFLPAEMEKPSEEHAVAEPADSPGEGGPPPVAGAQVARPEDHTTLLLRLFPLAHSAGTKCTMWPRAPPFALNGQNALNLDSYRVAV